MSKARKRDKKIFTKTALRTKKLNNSVKPMRGGTCL